MNLKNNIFYYYSIIFVLISAFFHYSSLCSYFLLPLKGIIITQKSYFYCSMIFPQ